MLNPYREILTAEGGNISGDNYRLTISYKDIILDAYNTNVIEPGDGITGADACVKSFLTEFSEVDPLTCTLAKPIFRLRYSPDTDDISGAIVPSRLEVFLINSPNSTDLDTFLSQVLEYQQSDRWAVLLERDTGSGYVPYWRGILLQDQIAEEDRSYNNVVKLTAADGLALLKSLDYDGGASGTGNTVTSAEPFYTPVKDVIRKALQTGISTDFWGASDEYLITSVNWWEDTQSYGATSDPLVTQVFDVRAFEKIVGRTDGLATLEYKTAYEVLQEFARIYLSRVYMAGGAYHFEQIPLRENQTVKENTYDKTGTQLTASIPNKSTTLNGTLDATRLAGNQFIKFPALKRVQVNLKPYSSTFDDQMELDVSAYGNSSTEGFGYIDSTIGNVIAFGSVNQRIVLNIDFDCAASWDWDSGDVVGVNASTSLGYIGMRPSVRVLLELNDINSATNYYWNGSSWQTSSTTFRSYGTDKILQIPTGTSGTYYWGPSDNVTQIFQTTDLPATGTITITLDDFKWQYLGTPTSWTNFATASTNGLKLLSGEVNLNLGTVFERGNTIRTIELLNSNVKIADNEIYAYPDIAISDGAVQTGCIMVNNGGTIVSATNWRIGNGSEDIALGALLVKQRLELQREVLEQYTGSVKMADGYDVAIVFDSKVWIASDYDLNGYSNDVNATWTKIGIVSEPSATATERNPILGELGDTRQGFFKYGGSNRIGGLPTANDLILGLAYDSTDNATRSTLPISMDTGQRNNYLVIDASSGGSGSLSETDTVAFISWTGAAGTFNLEIPDASSMDGARLEIVLDDSFDGSQDIVISPATGNIVGTTELTVNTTGRTLLRAISGNWW